jgi:ElaB/YqjD/DUF883 family membrane-anchored ribosome-binding protein
MAKSVLGRATDSIGESVHEASRFASSVADTVEDGLGTAKRAARDGHDAVEHFINDANKRVRRSPIESVLASLVAGLILGFVVGRATSGD